MAELLAYGLITATVFQGFTQRLLKSSVDVAFSAAGAVVGLLGKAVTGSAIALSQHPEVKRDLESMDIAGKMITVQALIMAIKRSRGLPLTLEPTSRDALDATALLAKPQQSSPDTIETANEDDLVIVKQPLEIAPSLTLTGEEDVVAVCLELVTQSLASITKPLEALHVELQTHEQRWFSSWRTPNTMPLLEELHTHVKVLDTRVDMLLKCHEAFDSKSSRSGAAAPSLEAAESR